ncbi:hypothetical protein JQX13_38785 [Archangium violaceum]|uniref:hypothetical protein n=1 Tax=Archangium violaceum TaxID=83451 RepID=UPI00193C17FD|nr:hypothetical protein [Archangium violaceum]QRK06030.1 hypothetical protein JQX13_38785 [Archangium violaceum]
MTSPRCAHQANALTLDIELREARAEVRRMEAALESSKAARQLASDNAEELADRLHQEAQAHERTRQLLEDAGRERERLLSVAVAAHLVLGVTDNPTTLEHQSERLRELGVALTNLRAALQGMEVPVLTVEAVANLIMFAAMRDGAQGRDFNARTAAELVVAWLYGRNALSLTRGLEPTAHEGASPKGGESHG